MPLMPTRTRSRRREQGFTLLELAISLVIVSLVSGGLMMALSARHNTLATSETQHRINNARDALLGFAAANGRLPCPAAPGKTGLESPPGGGTCTNPWDGFLPAVTLGLAPTNAQGYALDDWGNPIRYVITTYGDTDYCAGHMFATTNCLKAAWLNKQAAPDLHVCSSATGMSGNGASANCAAGSTLASNAVAVIFSRGANGGAHPRSLDESANGNVDRLFVSHTQTAAGTANEFDDIVTWLSPNIFYYRLIAAGRLP
jgi:prepilin-type N-terminal cleavage/methylation domain-containing protein